MKYIREYKEGDRMAAVYLCKRRQSAVTKNGKAYETVVLQDKTGTIDAKVWDPNNPGIGDFDVLDYIEVYGDINSFQGTLQVNVRRIRRCREGEYDPADYLPVSSRSIDEMYSELLKLVSATQNPYLRRLLESFFVEDRDFIKAFRASSAAKSVHHGYVGGLLEHSLNVAGLCEYFCGVYPALHRDLLITAALCHDIGKTKELSRFPENDYTDDGQLLGHIIIGTEMVSEKIRSIPDFPPVLASELKHCILSHHGELEFGSPKKPALYEALALSLADNADAKLESFKEVLDGAARPEWLGYNKLFESNLRPTKLQ